jgi:hypothetical protein
MEVVDPDTALIWGQIACCQSGFISCLKCRGFSWACWVLVFWAGLVDWPRNLSMIMLDAGLLFVPVLWFWSSVQPLLPTWLYLLVLRTASLLDLFQTTVVIHLLWVYVWFHSSVPPLFVAYLSAVRKQLCCLLGIQSHFRSATVEALFARCF